MDSRLWPTQNASGDEVSGQTTVAKRVSYIPFLALAAEWAAESGMPPELALRNVCEWTMAGAFPPDSLKTAIGTPVASIDIYISLLALTQDRGPFHSGSIQLGSWTLPNVDQRWGLNVLSEILVTAPDVLAFCERTRTLPPPSVLNNAQRMWMRWTRNLHLAPPPFPQAEDMAIRHHEREVAVATLNFMRSKLNRFTGKQSQYGPIEHPMEGDQEAEWEAERIRASQQIEKCGDTSLLQQLHDLETEWASFLANVRLSGTEAPAAEDQESPAPDEAERQVARERTGRRGRPPGSGSLEAADAPLVDEMRVAILNDPTLSRSAAAAKVVDRAKGGGTSESKIQRLSERYSAKFGLRN